jgi:3'-phosphoadenosine 5'-phosphosulfate sulfotransferase (PAPS reductase)/FAD synthetase
MTGTRRIVVGFSGGVTSAWCAGWALRKYPRDEVVLLWHDTKEEDEDTYRFLREMAAALGMPITERSDGRSVTQLFRDVGYLGNGQQTPCSRILKAEQGSRYVEELRASGVVEILKVIGYSQNERARIQRMVGRCAVEGITPVFPMVHENVTKQEATDWVIAQGVRPPAMYCWAEHANCVGCVKGGRAYWLAVAANAPDVFEQRAQLEEEFGHTIIRGELRKGETRSPTLRELVKIGLKRKVGQREKIDIGVCDCGD